MSVITLGASWSHCYAVNFIYTGVFKVFLLWASLAELTVSGAFWGVGLYLCFIYKVSDWDKTLTNHSVRHFWNSTSLCITIS